MLLPVLCASFIFKEPQVLDISKKKKEKKKIVLGMSKKSESKNQLVLGISKPSKNLPGMKKGCQ